MRLFITFLCAGALVTRTILALPVQQLQRSPQDLIKKSAAVEQLLGERAEQTLLKRQTIAQEEQTEAELAAINTAIGKANNGLGVILAGVTQAQSGG